MFPPSLWVFGPLCIGFLSSLSQSLPLLIHVSDPHNFGFPWPNIASKISLYAMNFHSRVFSISNSQGEENLRGHTLLSEPGLVRHLACSDQVCAPTLISCGPESLGHKTWLPGLVPLQEIWAKRKKWLVTLNDACSLRSGWKGVLKNGGYHSMDKKESFGSVDLEASWGTGQLLGRSLLSELIIYRGGQK